MMIFREKLKICDNSQHTQEKERQSIKRKKESRRGAAARAVIVPKQPRSRRARLAAPSPPPIKVGQSVRLVGGGIITLFTCFPIFFSFPSHHSPLCSRSLTLPACIFFFTFIRLLSAKILLALGQTLRSLNLMCVFGALFCSHLSLFPHFLFAKL